ncbi:MAG: hypothetical protein ACR2P6_03090 [Gammaproteobacteria bacterium]
MPRTFFVAAVLCLSGLSAQAAVITFDNTAKPGIAAITSGYQESGVDFSGRFGHHDLRLPDGATPRLEFANGTFMFVSMQDDSLFSLKSVDLGEYSSVFEGQQLEITIMGRKADGTLVSQSFQLDGDIGDGGDPRATTASQTFAFSSEFSNLQAAYFENTSSRAPYHPLLDDGRYGYPDEFNTNVFNMDNLVVTSVPVPAAFWLLGSALGLLGWIRRRA